MAESSGKGKERAQEEGEGAKSSAKGKERAQEEEGEGGDNLSLSSTERHLWTDALSKSDPEKRLKLYQVKPDWGERLDRRAKDALAVLKLPKLHKVEHRKDILWKWQTGGYKEDKIPVFTSRNVASQARRRLTIMKLQQSIQSYVDVNWRKLKSLANGVNITAAQIESPKERPVGPNCAKVEYDRAVMRVEIPDVFEGAGTSRKAAMIQPEGTEQKGTEPKGVSAVIKNLTKGDKKIRIGVVQFGELEESPDSKKNGHKWVKPALPLLAIAVDTRQQTPIAAFEAQMITDKRSRAVVRSNEKRKAEKEEAKAKGQEAGAASSSGGQAGTKRDSEGYYKRLADQAHQDLNKFHSDHLDASAPEASLVANNQDIEEDDGLGYYADGVKRTLTDEQIAMFRHTEIQKLLQRQRRKREAEEEAAEELETEALEAASSPRHEQPSHAQVRSGAPKNATGSSDPYRAKSKFDYRYEPLSRQTRNRRTREMDDQKAKDIELDY
ncbi:MAG: hypothetical protein Q9162_007931 [Coniocarpon cinnabarinum]